MGFITSTVVGLTDTGLVREHNEDSFIIGYPRTGQIMPSTCSFTLPRENNTLLLTVSDGMGGANAGEIASKLTVDTIMTELPRLPAILSPYCRLEAAVEAANYAVWSYQKSNPALRGMGATATVMLIEGSWVYISEVGDSRAYIIRNGHINQITTDQTMVQVMLDSGSISPEVAERSSHRNVLLQAIGKEEHLQVACSSIELHDGDIFLICSDGLSGKVKALEMFDIVNRAETLGVAAEQLISLAKDRGGNDNITVILAQFSGAGLKPQNASDPIIPFIEIISRFDPKLQTTARTMRQIRPASFEDWVSMAIVDYFAETPEQRAELANLGRYGDYVMFRRNDQLVFQGERSTETDYHYWLASGRYLMAAPLPDGNYQPIAFIVSPTDMRSNEDIQAGYEHVPVKRQFFAASVAILNNSESGVTIWCMDEENVAIRVPIPVYEKVARILGVRFLNSVRHSGYL
jgi:PPM family protein phosphatase